MQVWQQPKKLRTRKLNSHGTLSPWIEQRIWQHPGFYSLLCFFAFLNASPQNPRSTQGLMYVRPNRSRPLELSSLALTTAVNLGNKRRSRHKTLAEHSCDAPFDSLPLEILPSVSAAFTYYATITTNAKCNISPL